MAAQELGETQPDTMYRYLYHAVVGRQCQSCNRVGGADGVLARTHYKLSKPFDATEGGTRVRPK
jgi:hypothetical protein